MLEIANTKVNNIFFFRIKVCILPDVTHERQMFALPRMCTVHRESTKYNLIDCR